MVSRSEHDLQMVGVDTFVFTEGYYMEVSNDCMNWDTPMK
jgi:hypothetical protein